MRLIDSHAHLQAERFGPDRAEVVAAARSAGLERLLIPGWDLPSSHAAAELSPQLLADAAAGIHPHVASLADEPAWEGIVGLAGEPGVVAIGETGLDYDREFSPREAQLANLRRHIALAFRLGKPLILHCRSKAGRRDAQDDLLRELTAGGVGQEEWRAMLGERPPAVIHSFSGPVDYGERVLALGLAVSFSGLVFRRGEEASAEVVRLVPPESLLVETDSPYLSPPGAPRGRNEPRWVETTARWVAEQRREDPEALGQSLVTSYERTFGRRVLESARD
ncbi:MAG: TatD family hydrolase [Chloroflexota bacterium]|nr:TatD family hydrolase [Chloroflexota bacterium]